MREHATQMGIKYIGIILMAVFMMANPMVVNATQYVPETDGAVIYEEQPINNFTGEVITNNEQQMSGEIKIATNCVYDKETKTFTYSVEDKSGKKVMSTIADGMITNDRVSLDVGDHKEFQLYKDGKKLKDPNMNSIEEPGTYVLLFEGRKVIEFTIAGAASSFHTFSLPGGFSVDSVKMEDGTAKGHSSSQINFDEEGKYTVHYRCNYTGERYSFTTVIDHTPPVLALEAVDEENKAYGPVDISDVEENGRVVVLLNGKEINTTGKLTQNGPYTVTVYDEAGNSTTYNFLIMLYFNVSGIGFLLGVIGVVLGLGIYVVVSTKRYRVC